MNIENKFLLVCLQLIIVLLLMLVNVEGLRDMRSRHRLLSDEPEPSPIPPSKYLTLSSTSPVARAYRLHNLRAKADVVMDNDNRVSATALNSDLRGELGLESVMKEEAVRTRIRGLVTDTYLCFNQKGRLVAKPKGRARGEKCEFIEQVDEESGSSSFKSALNPRWRVGFNQKGHSLLGSTYEDSDCRECFLFYKTTINTPTRKHPPPSRLTHRNYDPVRHNHGIGQIHPGLNPNFLSSFPFPPPESSLMADGGANPLNNLQRQITSTTPPTLPVNSQTQSSRHRLRHRKKKHRHQHKYGGHKKRHEPQDTPNSTQ